MKKFTFGLIIYTFLILDYKYKPDDIGLVTCAYKHQLPDAKKPFMAIYLKSKSGENVFSSQAIINKTQIKHRGKKSTENSSDSNVLKSNFLNFLLSKIIIKIISLVI